MSDERCPKCRREGYKREWGYMTYNERGYTSSHGTRAARNAASGHPLGLAVWAVAFGVKVAFSRVYSCSKCGREWRKWF